MGGERFDGDRRSDYKTLGNARDEDLRSQPKYRDRKPYMTVTGDQAKDPPKSKAGKPPTPLGRARRN